MENRPKTAGGGAGASGDDECDLSPDIIRRIEHAWATYESTDYYTILGLTRDAPVRRVRTAFLAAAAPFHPDRYFGRKLGPYKERMIRIFSRMSLAHDTLVSDEKRIHYDLTLPPEEPRAQTPPPPPARVQTPVPVSRPPASQTMTTAQPLRRDTPAPSSHESGARPTAEVERARAAAFAMRMGRSMGKKLTPSTPMPAQRALTPMPLTGGAPGTTSDATKAAAESLKRRYEESVRRIKDQQVAGLLKAGDAAAAKGDLAGAARAYREAANTSGDALLKARADELESQSKEKAHETALKRARDAEASQNWGEAGAQYAKVFDLKPTADSAYRAANALRRDGGDLRRAARYGEEAVKMDPSKAAFHLVLALTYMDAGLILRARSEMEHAKEIDPGSSSVKEALARLKTLK